MFRNTNRRSVRVLVVIVALTLSSMACNLEGVFSDYMDNARQEACASGSAYSTCNGNLEDVDQALDTLINN